MSRNDSKPLAHYFTSTDPEAFRRGFDADPFHRQLGVSLVERGDGTARVRLAIGAGTPQGIGGAVHGGVLASLVDIAMLVAVFSKLRPGQLPAGTADLAITYMRQAHGDQVLAEARVVKHGRQLSVIEVDLSDDAGVLCARGRVLYAFRATA